MPKKTRLNMVNVLIFALLLAALGIFTYIGLERAERENSGEVLSSASLQALQSLNFEHQMWIEELVVEEEQEPLMAQLLMANSLDTGEVDRSHRGLVVTLDSPSEDAYLMLRPSSAIPDLQLETLAQSYENLIPEFEYVELDQDVELSGEPFYWGVNESDEVLLSEQEEPEYKLIHVGIIDSGLDDEHEFFEQHQIETGWNTIDLNTDTYDDIGHGTHVAGIIAANAPGAVLSSYKIYNHQGGRLSNVLAAIDAAVEDEVDILNMSFGLTSPSDALRTILERASDQGIVSVAAAGNNNNSRGFYPAAFEEVLGVASVDAEGEKMPLSNYGEWVHAAAYGYQVRSTLPGNSYGHKSGNSQSAAFVTAAVARVMAAQSLETRLSREEVFLKLWEEGELIEEGPLAGVLLLR